MILCFFIQIFTNYIRILNKLKKQSDHFFLVKNIFASQTVVEEDFTEGNYVTSNFE